jgi:hypothetical protein
MLALHGRIDPVEYYPCPQHRVVYVENAKTACTAIKQVLFPDVSYQALGQDGFHEKLRQRALHRPTPEQGDWLYFTFLRDPDERLASCYRDKLAGNADSIFDSRSQRLIFRQFGGVDLASSELTQEQFGAAARRIPARLRDRHIMDQALISDAAEAMPNHFIGSFEALEHDWQTLQALTGLPDLPVLNPSAPPEKTASSQ